ncbi:MAG: aminoacyl-tRNA hydrolase [Gemmatimonadales bacterium]|nr:MAG: aminoacyl-tRNA hydrolase [Gemmatimonadales bacterium]
MPTSLPVKLVVGLGNPGPDYDNTRHNVGWWMIDRLAHDLECGPFRQEGPALVSSGQVDGFRVILVKPLTYMNRSGAALGLLAGAPELDFSQDLLVVVDDATREVGQVRFRPGGSSGGHNGLKSIEQVLGSQAWARLRIGVGRTPEGVGMADWVLSPMEPDEEDVVLDLLPTLVAGVRSWMGEGIQVAMDRHNR